MHGMKLSSTKFYDHQLLENSPPLVEFYNNQLL